MIKLQPVLKDYLWGGEKLKTLFGREKDGIIAESWEVSVHKDGESTISGTNKTFAEYLKENKNAVDLSGGEFPVLIKYIDAAKNLSVQVHPNDEYAQKYEHDNGKTEMWYIVSADDGAGIYCGFKRDMNKEEFLAKVKDDTVEELLNFISVKAGDCYLIKAGTVHAIGAGCVICEIQQNSNVTYRVYDYNRRGSDGKLRPLHVEKAVDVIDFKAFKDETNGGEYEKLSGNNGEIRHLTACKYFRTRELKLNGKYSEKNDKTFTAIDFVSGSGEINGEKFVSGDSFFIPCGEEFTVSGNATAILTTENTLKYYAGIDLGGTGIKCGIVDENGKIVAIKKCPTKKGVEAKEILFDMANLVKDLQKETGLKLEGVGVGCPGLIDTEKGNVVYSNNLAWKNVSLIKTLKEELNLPVYVTNDANAAALGEYYFGAGKKYKSLVMLTLGTGVGSGIVFNGKLFEGNLGAGVELGHEVIKIGGEKCTCGRKGCLEAYASATALIRQAQKAMESDKDSLLWKLTDGNKENVNGKIVFDALREGDKTAEKVVKKYTEYLAAGVTNVINAFHPQAIVLGGGIRAAGDVFLTPLKSEVNRGIFGGTKFAPVEIVVARLGNDAGIYGAAALAFDKE